jgi:hypothetical protein
MFAGPIAISFAVHYTISRLVFESVGYIGSGWRISRVEEKEIPNSSFATPETHPPHALRSE